MKAEPGYSYVRPSLGYIIGVDWANNLLIPPPHLKGDPLACPRIGSPPYFDETQCLDEGFANKYPFRPDKLETILAQRVEGSYSNFIQVFKDADGGVVNIVVLGGSMTEGIDCSQRLHDGTILQGRECAWSARLRKILQNAFPSTKINLINLAHGGTTSSVVLGGLGLIFRSLGDLRIDMVMLDTLVNDAGEALRWGAASTKLTAEQVVSISYEGLVRALHDHRPETMIVSLFTGCKKCFKMKPHQHAIANHYNLPHIDYAELVEANRNDRRFWNPPGANHPDWMAHQLVADVIGGAWDKVLQKACNNADADSHFWPSAPFNTEEDLSIFPSCRQPLTYISAFESIKPNSAATQPSYLDGWRLFEDRPGKPGWISETPYVNHSATINIWRNQSVNHSATMRVPVMFGAAPKLSVTFLRSYEGLGDAILTMNGKTAKLQGLWGNDNLEKVSQSYVAWFDAGAGGHVGFGIAPNQTVELEIQSLGGKCKILEISSC